MRRILLTAWLVFCVTTPVLRAGYKIKPIHVKKASEYASNQKFQNIVIGAYPCNTKDRILELFDTDKLYETGIMPVLVVIQNNNAFAIRIEGSRIFLSGQGRSNRPPIPFSEVLLASYLPGKRGTYSTRPELLVRRYVPRQVFEDFQHKAFGERLIPPHGSDYGVVFFPLPVTGDVEGLRLYLPEVYDLTHKKMLMFFEFELEGEAK